MGRKKIVFAPAREDARPTRIPFVPAGTCFLRIVKSSHEWLGYFHPTGKASVVFCDGHVESPTLPFLFAATSDAALARWKSLRTATNPLPHRKNLSPQYFIHF
jgi:prepilin-type processing-associated H-X9-DG protein